MPRTTSTDHGELVRLAIAGIDAQLRELEEKRSALLRLVAVGRRAGTPKAAAIGESRQKKRVFSAATKRRLSIAAKRRWARARAEKKAKS